MEKRSDLMPDHRWFEMVDGRKIGAHKHSCLFCKHNTDIFYDYTNGPYMFICDLGSDNIEKSFEGKCPNWEEDQ